MSSCPIEDIKIDFAIPSRDKPNPNLIRIIEKMPYAGEIINTYETA